MLVREALPSDCVAISRLFEEVDALHAAAQPDVFRLPETPGRARRFIQEKLEDIDGSVFVAEANGNVIGFASVRLGAAPDIVVLRPRRFAYLEDIVVAPEWRRSGVGTALLRRVEAWTRARRIDRLELVVWDFNQSAVDFYAALGYRTDYRWMSRNLTAG
jgi:ribosomal protein S18 acetylase RimI-like enzyme